MNFLLRTAIFLILPLPAVLPCCAAAPRAPVQFENRVMRITIAGGADALWRYQVKGSGRVYSLLPPVFEVDGVERRAALSRVRALGAPARLQNGATEYRFEGEFAADPSLSLEMVFRAAADNPVVRFSYILKSKTPHTLTKSTGGDRLVYLGASLQTLPQATEVRISEFVELAHSYSLTERLLDPADFESGHTVMGPILVGSDGRHSFLLAYEHGSQYPDAFLEFDLKGNRSVNLRAVKGNYLTGQRVDSQHPYRTIWLEAAAVDGDHDAMASAYRTFVRQHMSLSPESRKPYIIYNSWNYQEREKWWKGKKYLNSMNEERMLLEIDAAYRLGIDLFELDAGWFEKTGDWAVNRKRFPGGLSVLKRKLDGYGMKLGLWFDPGAAAVSSEMLRKHRAAVVSWQGQEAAPRLIWETEESYRMCLVSSYTDSLAEELIRLAREEGVRYFLWDAIGSYGCDSPNHWHGDERHSPKERSESYAFQLVGQLTRVAEKLSEAFPDVIVDFDVTEKRRAFGLGFLAAGRFFLVNNGPYYADLNIPIPPNTNRQAFFYPGPARGWVCRIPLALDKWLPSALFTDLYLTDDPYESQMVNIGSVVAGNSGMWGDLPAVSPEGVKLFGKLMGRYKQVREDIAESDPVRSGVISGSPEIYEKISSRTGRGAVVVFAMEPGRYTYVTRNRVAPVHWSTEGVSVRRDGRQRAILNMDFATPGAKIVYFGVN